jgi:hypothetical protein
VFTGGGGGFGFLFPPELHAARNSSNAIARYVFDFMLIIPGQ